MAGGVEAVADPASGPLAVVEAVGVLGAPLVGVGVPLGLAAFLVGRWHHRGGGWPPRRPEPDGRVAALLAVAVCWVLLSAWLLQRV